LVLKGGEVEAGMKPLRLYQTFLKKKGINTYAKFKSK